MKNNLAVILYLSVWVCRQSSHTLKRIYFQLLFIPFGTVKTNNDLSTIKF